MLAAWGCRFDTMAPDMIRRTLDLLDELAGRPFHPRDQQESAWGIVLRFLGWPCECETEELGGCTYPGLGWRCGHRRRPWRRQQTQGAGTGGRLGRLGCPVSSPQASSWIDAVSDIDKGAALGALHELVHGGDFAAWMRAGGQEMPIAAARLCPFMAMSQVFLCSAHE